MLRATLPLPPSISASADFLEVSPTMRDRSSGLLRGWSADAARGPANGEVNFFTAASSQPSKLPILKHMRSLLGLFLTFTCFSQSAFDAQWTGMTHKLSHSDLYRLVWDLPKGGDLHNHHEYSVPMTFWLDGAGKRGYFVRYRKGCGDTLQWTVLRQDSLRRLEACEQRDFAPIRMLSGAQKKTWLAAMTMSPRESGKTDSKDVFFQRVIPRLGDLERDPELIANALVVAQNQLRDEHAIYLETQADPRSFPGLTEDQGAEILRKRLAQTDSDATGVSVRMQVSTLRFSDHAEEDLRDGFDFVSRNFDLWKGLNLVGREDDKGGAPGRFASVFKEMTARYPQVRISLHAGESSTKDSHVTESISLGATRIGHGINAALDPSAMELLRSGKFLIEICLVSNRALGYVPDLRLHPFPSYLRQRVPVNLNTDDRGITGSNLTDEYFLAVSLFDLSWSEVVQIGRWSLEYSFAEPELKVKLLSRYDENIRAFERKYSSADWKSALRQVRLPIGHDLPRL